MGAFPLADADLASGVQENDPDADAGTGVGFGGHEWRLLGGRIGLWGGRVNGSRITGDLMDGRSIVVQQSIAKWLNLTYGAGYEKVHT